MKCSILIAHHNGIEIIDKCLKSIKKQTYKDFEVIVLDNNSTDNSVEFIENNHPWVQVVRMGDVSPIDSLNKGIKHCSGEYIVILDNDTEVDKYWLYYLLDCVNMPSVGIVGSMAWDKSLNSYIGEGKINLLGISSINTTNTTKVRECDWVTGCSFLIKREVLDKVKYLYDPNYFAYFEEVDLCWRARKAGYKVMYTPLSKLIHKGSATTDKRYLDKKKLWHYRNKIWTYKKNLRPPLRYVSLFFLFFLTLLKYKKAVKYIFKPYKEMIK